MEPHVITIIVATSLLPRGFSICLHFDVAAELCGEAPRSVVSSIAQASLRGQRKLNSARSSSAANDELKNSLTQPTLATDLFTGGPCVENQLPTDQCSRTRGARNVSFKLKGPALVWGGKKYLEFEESDCAKSFEVTDISRHQLSS